MTRTQLLPVEQIAPEFEPQENETALLADIATHFSPEPVIIGLAQYDVEEIRKVLPFTEKLFTKDKETRITPSPTAEAFNEFADTYFRPLGATTMRVKQLIAGKFSPPFLTDCYAAGIIPMATEDEELDHDATDHMFGAISFHEGPTQIFRQVAHLSQSMRETDPESAQMLDIAIAHIFDYRSSLYNRYLLHPYSNAGDINEQPLLLTHVNSFLSGTFIKTRIKKGWGGEKLPIIAKIGEAIEQSIDDVPEDETIVYLGTTKIERWAEWETNNMPAYAVKLKEVLTQDPNPTRRSKVAAFLGRKAAKR